MYLNRYILSRLEEKDKKGLEIMIIQLSAGQGPEECQLAVGKLFEALKMEYTDLEMISKHPGKRAGCYHSVQFVTEEDLKELEGTVLWICKSPLRPEHKRKNWYVDVSIIPEVKHVDTSDEYRIETFHSGGNGGQNVNKVETGVRIIHIPTGITSECTEERSQFMNRQRAIKKIHALLALEEEKAKTKQIGEAWIENYRIVRGNPVRTYEGPDFKRKK